MSPVTRRGALSLIPAAAASIAAPAAALATLNPDAELIRLGERLSEALPAYLKAKAESAQTFKLWREELVRRKINVNIDSGPEMFEFAEGQAYLAASDRYSDLADEIVPISEAIRELQPQTIAGLAIWGRAAAFEAADCGDTVAAYAASDCTTCQIYELVEQIERMAGGATCAAS